MTKTTREIEKRKNENVYKICIIISWLITILNIMIYHYWFIKK